MFVYLRLKCYYFCAFHAFMHVCLDKQWYGNSSSGVNWRQMGPWLLPASLSCPRGKSESCVATHCPVLLKNLLLSSDTSSAVWCILGSGGENSWGEKKKFSLSIPNHSLSVQPTPVFLPGEFHGQETGRLQSMGSQRVGYDRGTNIFTFTGVVKGKHPKKDLKVVGLRREMWS